MQVRGSEWPTAIYSAFTLEVTTTCLQASESSRIRASISFGEVQAASAPAQQAHSSLQVPGWPLSTQQRSAGAVAAARSGGVAGGMRMSATPTTMASAEWR